MFDNFIILVITAGTLAVFAYLNRRSGSGLTHEGVWVFRYPVHIRWRPVVALVIIDSLVVWQSVYKSGGNPGAAMTKLCTPKALGNKKIRLEVLMQGYDQTVAEVRKQAKNAEFVET